MAKLTKEEKENIKRQWENIEKMNRQEHPDWNWDIKKVKVKVCRGNRDKPNCENVAGYERSVKVISKYTGLPEQKVKSIVGTENEVWNSMVDTEFQGSGEKVTYFEEMTNIVERYMDDHSKDENLTPIQFEIVKSRKSVRSR
jgi:hypothetical protein